MKIGFDASRVGIKYRTGVEEYSVQIFRYLKKHDRENEYIVYTIKNDSPEFDNMPDNFHLRVMPFPKIWTQIRLAWELLIHPPDLLFVPSHVAPVLCFVPYVVAVHDIAFKFFPKTYSVFVGKLVLPVTTFVTSLMAKKIITISETTKKDLVKYYKIKPEKIAVTYLAYEDTSEKIDFTKERWGSISKKFRISSPYLFFVGRVETKKNLVKLVEAFYDILSRGHDYQLVLAGKDGVGANSVKEKVKELNIEDRVVFTGYITAEEKEYLYHHASIFTFPSLYEGFGIPMLEAFSRHLPVVASSIPVFEELFSDSALLADPNSAKDIADRIEEFVKSEDKRKKYIERGLEETKNFSWEKCGAETLDILNNVGGE